MQKPQLKVGQMDMDLKSVGSTFIKDWFGWTWRAAIRSLQEQVEK